MKVQPVSKLDKGHCWQVRKIQECRQQNSDGEGEDEEEDAEEDECSIEMDVDADSSTGDLVSRAAKRKHLQLEKDDANEPQAKRSDES